MEDPKSTLLARIKESTNVLVTVSKNPSLDQLAGAVGLTLLLNKIGKHGTAVFSGEVPSILEYLKPEETLEKNTDSLRDFIIALDKSKADKLRYKVEDTHVKIFITPYHTAITEADLEFSQGDFNVDLVIALGVHDPKDLDEAITAHGRILHDATVSSINTSEAGNLGNIHWADHEASSLCEMLYQLCVELKPDALDGQMATALLTGIVSETKRFGNERTTARTMEVSSHLMESGANQQLVAVKLESLAAEKPEPKPKPLPPKELEKPKKAEAIELPKIEHSEDKRAGDKVYKPAPKVKEEKKEAPDQALSTETSGDEDDLEEIRIDDQGVLYRPTDEITEEPKTPDNNHRIMTPPDRSGTLTANTAPEDLLPAVDPLSEVPEMPFLAHNSGSATSPATDNPTSAPTEPSVQSGPDLDTARDAVTDAVNALPDAYPEPRFDLNAMPMEAPPAVAAEPADPSPVDTPLLQDLPTPSPIAADDSGAAVTSPTPTYDVPTLPPGLVPNDPALPPDDTASSTDGTTPPPPVPPPMLPPTQDTL